MRKHQKINSHQEAVYKTVTSTPKRVRVMNDTKRHELSKAGGDQEDTRSLNAMWGLGSGRDKEHGGETGKLGIKSAD